MHTLYHMILRVPLSFSFFFSFFCHLQHSANFIFVFTFGQEFDLAAVKLQLGPYLLAALIKSAMYSSSLVAHK